MMDDEVLILNDRSALRLIGRGNTAEIFLYNGCALKLFRDAFPESGVWKEWCVTRSVQAVYGNMPKALRLVKCGERRGILYELADGDDLLRLIGKNPLLLFTTGKKLAALHAEMHEKEIAGILTVKEKLKQEIRWANGLSEEEKRKLTDCLSNLPNGNRLCHFDFHPGNVMICDGKITVLDWLTACSGDPAADIARTTILLKYGELKNSGIFASLILRVVKACIREPYLRNSLRLSGIKQDEIKQWIAPVAAARLSEWLTEHERARLLKLIRSALKV